MATTKQKKTTSWFGSLFGGDPTPDYKKSTTTAAAAALLASTDPETRDPHEETLRFMVLNPAFTAAGSPVGAPVATAAAAITLKVPRTAAKKKGKFKCMVNMSPAFYVDGSGAAGDADKVQCTAARFSPAMTLTKTHNSGDDIVITPYFNLQDSLSLLAGKVAVLMEVVFRQDVDDASE